VSLSAVTVAVRFNSAPALNFGCFEAGMTIFSPVRGLRTSVAARSLTWNVPNPGSLTSSPLANTSETTAIKASTALPASLLVVPVFSAIARTKSAFVHE
jgi:hypothetical protein